MLEAQIIDLADEIAYNTADLDDGFSAGMFSIEQVIDEVPHYRDLWEAVDTQFAGAPENIRFNEALRMLIDLAGNRPARRNTGGGTLAQVSGLLRKSASIHNAWSAFQMAPARQTSR